ncbi:MAG: AAA domain-containing protein, partial [Ktedonobacteraceae bacterium]
EYSEMVRLRAAVVEKLPGVIAAEIQRRRSRFIENRFLALERDLERVGGNANPAEVVQRLYYAVKKRDAAAYEQAYHRLVNLHAKRAGASQREALLRKLEGQAPAWANAIRERIGKHGKSEVPGSPDDAWLWRQLSDELERRAKISLGELQDRVARLNSDLFQVTAELVEKRAWEKQIRHTTVEQRRALQGWRELMKKVGKGTGKRAPRLLAEAQQLIPICQSAVPVWIMPLNYVARNFDMKRNHFDVIILDEASQADITALFAAYMGDQIVIVGDDEQVSPMAVGQQTETVNQLIDEHLRGIPLRNMYDGKLSIYSLARTTFEPVCLLEHFRCVSPIITFSNDLSYQGKIKPLRDDSEVQRRPFTVAYAVKSSGKEERVNRAEAESIASLLIAATQQPEYQDATFGVISMVAGGQATSIDRLIQKYLSAPEYMQRRILCGDPSQFQGDERDVIFLSLVDVAENGPLPLRNGDANEYMWKKRFNVAASRARDQLWVVHSLDPEIDLKPGDIRGKLILYARDQHLQKVALATQEQRTESEFEKQVLQRLVRAGYRVATQWPVGAYRIDMVVEGNNRRLAVECDGDRWHPVEKLAEDMARQAILERLGWRFVRIRGSQFFRDPDLAMQPVFDRLQALDLSPIGMITEKQSNPDGQDLKDRIIRQADVLRNQWRKPENVAVLTSDAGLATKQPTVLRQDAVTAAKDSVDSDRIKAAAQRNTLPSSGVRPVPSVAPAQNLADRAFAKPVPPQPVANRSTGNAAQVQFNPIIHLQTRGYKVIDRRDHGGGVWVVGGNELAPMMKLLAEKGYAFKQIPGGLGPAVDGWYLRSF